MKWTRYWNGKAIGSPATLMTAMCTSQVVAQVSGFPPNPGRIRLYDDNGQLVGQDRYLALVALYHEHVTRRHAITLLRRGVKVIR